MRVYNERGAVLGGVIVSERIMPGAVYQDHGARCDSIVLGEGGLDRGGANNLIAPTACTSNHAHGEVTSGFLVNIEKVDVPQACRGISRSVRARLRSSVRSCCHCARRQRKGRRIAMGKVFIFDAAKCNGCRNCQLACKDEHVDNEWLPYAKPQPDTGQFWTSMEEIIRGQVPKVKVSYVMHRCQHCDNAPCMKAAPDAVYKREDGLVIIDPVKAEGKRELVDACPYGAIFWNEELSIPQKCTGCAHLVDEGELPHCVDVCPHEALRLWGRRGFC